MTNTTQGADQAPADISVVSLPDSAPESFSISKAARALQSVRFKDKDTPAEAPIEAAEGKHQRHHD